MPEPDVAENAKRPPTPTDGEDEDNAQPAAKRRRTELAAAAEPTAAEAVAEPPAETPAEPAAEPEAVAEAGAFGSTAPAEPAAPETAPALPAPPPGVCPPHGSFPGGLCQRYAINTLKRFAASSKHEKLESIHARHTEQQDTRIKSQVEVELGIIVSGGADDAEYYRDLRRAAGKKAFFRAMRALAPQLQYLRRAGGFPPSPKLDGWVEEGREGGGERLGKTPKRSLRRYDTDGGLYTKADFVWEYGGVAEWDAAKRQLAARAAPQAQMQPPP